MSSQKKISIHLNSNKPESFENFINSIKSTASNIENIEILVSIDKNDLNMIKIIKKHNDNKNFIRYIETSLIKSFADAWKPLNILLSKTSDSVLFISCVSDDLRFVTKKWDEIIMSYNHYYDDDLFRIRCSKYKHEKYLDIWECGYKPDSYAFYTKKWLDIVGQWNPCIGPDSFQECVSFYMSKYGENYKRNIVNDEIEFKGEEVSTSLSFKDRIGRTRIYYKAFFILMSYKIQKIANDSAFRIISKINNNNNNNNITLNRFQIYLTNFSRRLDFFYHRGSPNHVINTKSKNIIFMIWCYLNFLDNVIVKIITYLYKKNYLKKIIKDQKKFKKIEKIINNE